MWGGTGHRGISFVDATLSLMCKSNLIHVRPMAENQGVNCYSCVALEDLGGICQSFSVSLHLT